MWRGGEVRGKRTGGEWGGEQEGREHEWGGEVSWGRRVELGEDKSEGRM